jgi:gag-polypeptide of LTR copia-type
MSDDLNVSTGSDTRSGTIPGTGMGTETSTVVPVIYQGDLTSIKLNGANYLDWSRAVTIALGGRRLPGYINGEIRAPLETDAKYFDWKATDYSVMATINNTMLPELGRNFLGAATAREMWLAIEATYSHKGDDARLFEVKERIRKYTQGTRSVQEYYSELQGLWG